MVKREIWIQRADLMNQDTLVVCFSNGMAACFDPATLLESGVNFFNANECLADHQLLSMRSKMSDANLALAMADDLRKMIADNKKI